MAKYAAGTTVFAGKTEGEIKALLRKRGVVNIGAIENGEAYSLMFEFEGVGYRITLPLPDPNSKSFTHTPTGLVRAEASARDAYRQEFDRRWRAFGAVIKAQIVAVEEGIFTMQSAFIGNALTESGQTVAEAYAPQLKALAKNGRMPSIMPPGVQALPPRRES